MDKETRSDLETKRRRYHETTLQLYKEFGSEEGTRGAET